MSGRGCTCHLLSHQSCDFKFKSLCSDCALLIYKGNISCQDVCSYSVKIQVEPRPSCVMWLDERVWIVFLYAFFLSKWSNPPLFSFFSKSSTIMRPKVPPPLPPKVQRKISVHSWNLSLVLSTIWETSSISYFFCSPNPSAHPNRSMRTASRTVRTTVGEPSSVVQVQRCQALQRPPLTSPRGPLPRSCHPTVAVA